MPVVTVHLPEAMIDALAWVVEAGFYHSRSEAIRAGIRLSLAQDLALATKVATPVPVPEPTPIPASPERRFSPAELTVKADPTMDLRRAGAGWASVVDACRKGAI